MKISELRLALERTKNSSTFREHDEVYDALAALVEVLSKYDDLNVREFCSRVHLKSAPKKKAKTAKPKSFNQDAVCRHLGELKLTRQDNRAFEAAIERVKADRQMRVDEVRELARRFLGQGESYKTKAAAIAAMLDRQIADVRASQRRGRIEELF